MDTVREFFDQFTWEVIIMTGLRITLILFFAWIGVKVLGKSLNRLEGKLITKSLLEGEPPSESQKRIETIVHLIRQACLLALC